MCLTYILVTLIIFLWQMIDLFFGWSLIAGVGRHLLLPHLTTSALHVLLGCGAKGLTDNFILGQGFVSSCDLLKDSP